MRVNRGVARVVSAYTTTEPMPFREAARMFLSLSALWCQVNRWSLEVETGRGSTDLGPLAPTASTPSR
jgi:hypothetical protein